MMQVIDELSTTDPELSGEQSVQEGQAPLLMPSPSATGNSQITVLKHSISEVAVDHRGSIYPACVELAIRNVSDTTIATALFDVVFYDGEGNVLGTVRHKEVDLPPSTSRALRINSPVTESDQLKSYDVKLVRTTTVEVEKVQLLRHEMRTNELGEEEMSGIVKNISEARINAAVVATFFDANMDNLGTRVVVTRDIEPHTARKCDLKFKPQPGDTVASYSLLVGEVQE